MGEVTALTTVIQTINYQVANRDWFGIDQRIKALDLDDMDQVLILTWVRTTFPIRKKLESWQDLVDRTLLHFGEEHKHLLHGIT